MPEPLNISINKPPTKLTDINKGYKLTRQKTSEVKGFCPKCGSLTLYDISKRKFTPHQNDHGQDCIGYGKIILYARKGQTLTGVRFPVISRKRNTSSKVPSFRHPKDPSFYCPHCGNLTRLLVSSRLNRIPLHNARPEHICPLSSVVVDIGKNKTNRPSTVFRPGLGLDQNSQKGYAIEPTKSVRTISGGLPGSNRRRF